MTRRTRKCPSGRAKRASLLTLAVAVGLSVAVVSLLTGWLEPIWSLGLGVALSIIVATLDLWVNVASLLRRRDENTGSRQAQSQPFVAYPDVNSALDDLLNWKGSQWRHTIPYIHNLREAVTEPLSAGTDHRWCLILAGEQCGKTRDLVEIIRQRSSDYGRVLLYKNDDAITSLASEDVGCPRTLVVVDKLHTRCRAYADAHDSAQHETKDHLLLDELCNWIETDLVARHNVVVDLLLASRNFPSDLSVIGWPKHPLWQMCCVTQRKFLNAPEFNRLLVHLEEHSGCKLEEPHRRLIESKWTGTFGPIVSAFESAQLSPQQQSEAVWQAYSGQFQAFWDSFLPRVEQETPGARDVFHAIYWLQQLSITPRRSIVVQLVSEWADWAHSDHRRDDRGVGRVEQVLAELSEYALYWDGDDDPVVSMPVESDVFEVGPADFTAFRRLWNTSGASPRDEDIFDFAYRAAVEKKKPIVGAMLWRILVAPPLDGVARFDLAVAYDLLGREVAAVENYYLVLQRDTMFAEYILQEPRYIARTDSVAHASTPSVVLEAYVVLCERLLSIPSVTIRELPTEVRILVLDISASAIEAFPQHVDAWWNRARVLDRLASQPGALEAFRRAIEFAPTSAEVLYEAAHSTFHTADNIASATWEEERASIEARLWETEEYARECKIELERLEPPLADLREELQREKVRLDDLKVVGEALESERRTATLVAEYEKVLGQHMVALRHRQVLQSALDWVSRLVKAVINDKVIADKRDGLVECLENLADQLELSVDERQCISDTLHQINFTAQPRTEAYLANEYTLKNLEAWLVKRMESKNEWVERSGKEVEMLQDQIKIMQEHRLALEGKITRHANAERMKIQERIDSVNRRMEAAVQRYNEQHRLLDRAEKTRQELQQTLSEFNVLVWEESQCQQALEWARQAHELDSSEITRALVELIDLTLKGRGNNVISS